MRLLDLCGCVSRSRAVVLRCAFCIDGRLRLLVPAPPSAPCLRPTRSRPAVGLELFVVGDVCGVLVCAERLSESP